jgi:hypothetical protein
MCIPVGTWNWTQNVDADLPAHTVIRCEDEDFAAARGGPGTCVIVDDYNVDNELIQLTPASSGSFRFAGMSVTNGTASVNKAVAVVAFYGGNPAMRVDHNVFSGQGAHAQQRMVRFSGSGNAVFYQNICVAYQCLDVQGRGAGGSPFGDTLWAAPTALGTEDFVFVEDNEFRTIFATQSGHAIDCNSGGRVVLRYNFGDKMMGQTHATASSQRARGCRAQEVYGNHATRKATGGVADNFGIYNSGVVIQWGNIADGPEATGFKQMLRIETERRNDESYPISSHPQGFGYCGAAPHATGTVHVNGTAVTHATGDLFDTSWVTGASSMMLISGVTTCTAGADNDACNIASVNSPSSITLTENAGFKTGATYAVGSPWDGNTLSNGYPCLDDLGRGQGDLLSGQFPNMKNVTLGNIVAWPRQALEPLYEFLNTWDNPGTGGAVFLAASGRFAANRDYYRHNGNTGCDPDAASCTTGVGVGTIEQRPDDCTTGVAWWATNQGEWDSTDGEGTPLEHDNGGAAPNGADGKMYVCSAPNTWTARYGGGADNTTGLPFPYPHPLRTNRPLLAQLVSFFDLEETGPTDPRLDAHGTNHLTPNAGVDAAAGIQGNAVRLTTNSAHLSRADSAALSAGNTNFTVAFWVYLTNTAGTPIAAHKGWNTPSQSEWRVWRNNMTGKMRFTVSPNGAATGGAAVEGGPVINTNAWYFVVAWHDTTANLIGIAVENGTPVTEPHATGVFDGTGPFQIGAGPAGAIGRVDQFGFWRRVLTAFERTWLYNSGAGRTYSQMQ